MEKKRRITSFRRLFLVSGLVIVLMPSLCLALGIAVFVVPGQLKEWVPLDAPPESIGEIVTADLFHVYVKSTSDRLFTCATYETPNEDHCWREMGELPTVPPDLSFDESFRRPGWLRPPGSIIQTLVVTDRAGDAGRQYRYALLSDGTIWFQTHSWSGLGELGLGFIVLIMAGVGLILGMIWVVLLWVKNGPRLLKQRKEDRS